MTVDSTPTEVQAIPGKGRQPGRIRSWAALILAALALVFAAAAIAQAHGAGPRGPQGITGPAGPPGDSGPRGPRGFTGPAGADAAAATSATAPAAGQLGAACTTPSGGYYPSGEAGHLIQIGSSPTLFCQPDGAPQNY
jgi:hypothetical protein